MITQPGLLGRPRPRAARPLPRGREQQCGWRQEACGPRAPGSRSLFSNNFLPREGGFYEETYKESQAKNGAKIPEASPSCRAGLGLGRQI